MGVQPLAAADHDGTDTVARIIGSFLPKYIPGKPAIVIRTMPGAAGAIANNVFYAQGKPNGLHLMMNSGSPIARRSKSRTGGMRHKK